MSTANNIVQITVSTTGPGITRKSFGKPLLLAYHNNFPELYRRYNGVDGLEAMVTDGFSASDPAYIQARSLLSNVNKPEYFFVGRLTDAFTQSFTLSVKAAEVRTNQVYSFNVVSPAGAVTAVSYTALVTDTETEVAAALASQIDAITGIGASSVAGVVTCDADNDGEMWRLAGYNFNLVDFKEATADSTLVTDYLAIKSQNIGSYGVFLSDCQSTARLSVLAAQVQTEDDIFFCNTFDTDNLDSASTVSTGYTFANANYTRSPVVFSGDQSADLAAAWVGVCLPLDAGSITWAYKQPSGVGADAFTSNQLAALDSNNVNYITEMYDGLDAMHYGKVPSGEYIDIVRGTDWQKATIRENAITLLTTRPKVPFTNAGIELWKSNVAGSLEEGVTRTFLDGEVPIEVTAPTVAEISTIDKQNRHLPDIRAYARVAGAIHTAAIAVVLSVE